MGPRERAPQSRLTVVLPAVLHRRLKARAAMDGVPVRTMVIGLVEKALERRSKP